MNKRLFCCLPEGQRYTEQPANVKAQEIEARARVWIANNPGVWSDWLSSVRKAAEARRRWSIRFLVENTRAYDCVNSEGEPFKVNAILTSALARILCEEAPEAAAFVELRSSIFERAQAERSEAVGALNG